MRRAGASRRTRHRSRGSRAASRRRRRCGGPAPDTSPRNRRRRRRGPRPYGAHRGGGRARTSPRRTGPGASCRIARPPCRDAAGRRSCGSGSRAHRDGTTVLRGRRRRRDRGARRGGRPAPRRGFLEIEVDGVLRPHHQPAATAPPRAAWRRAGTRRRAHGLPRCAAPPPSTAGCTRATRTASPSSRRLREPVGAVAERRRREQHNGGREQRKCGPRSAGATRAARAAFTPASTIPGP